MLDIPLELFVCFIESIYQRSLLIFLLLAQVVSSQCWLARNVRCHIGVVCLHSVIFIPHLCVARLISFLIFVAWYW